MSVSRKGPVQNSSDQLEKVELCYQRTDDGKFDWHKISKNMHQSDRCTENESPMAPHAGTTSLKVGCCKSHC